MSAVSTTTATALETVLDALRCRLTVEHDLDHGISAGRDLRVYQQAIRAEEAAWSALRGAIEDDARSYLTVAWLAEVLA